MSPEDTVSRLDALAERGAITGYTIEPAPDYLGGSKQVLTYSVYGDQRTGRRNLGRLVRDLGRLGASMVVHSRLGTVASSTGLRRTRELVVVATLPGRGRLRAALELVCELHAADGSRPRLGSWEVPDVRVCGEGGGGGRTVPAFAHTATLGNSTAVVLTLRPEPPLADMTSHPLRVLACWAPYLSESRSGNSRWSASNA